MYRVLLAIVVIILSSPASIAAEALAIYGHSRGQLLETELPEGFSARTREQPLVGLDGYDFRFPLAQPFPKFNCSWARYAVLPTPNSTSKPIMGVWFMYRDLELSVLVQMVSDDLGDPSMILDDQMTRVWNIGKAGVVVGEGEGEEKSALFLLFDLKYAQ